MAPRIHVDQALAPGAELALPANASRHVQVLRLQPGTALTLFDGRGGEWSAVVLAIGRREVSARVGRRRSIERELATPVTLAFGMPANERMDTLVEKATELGAAVIQPLVCARSVLRVAGERAERKAAHWQAVAAAACEQCGRNRLPAIASPRPLRDWLREALPPGTRGLLLSMDPSAASLAARLDGAESGPITLLSGPEGGFTAQELSSAAESGFVAVNLGPRVLRADTAPLAVLASIALRPAG